MPLVISPLVEVDIPSAIECIQLAFAEDPYAQWVYDRSKVHHTLLNRLSLCYAESNGCSSPL